MEKQGVDRDGGLYRAGLLKRDALRGGHPWPPGPPIRLVWVWGLVCLLAGIAAAADAPLILQAEASPANPAPGSPWTVLLLVDHGEPAQVMIRPPELSASLSLEQLHIEPRRGHDGKRATQVELRFIPLQAGPILLKPFEVSVPGRRELSPELRAFAGDASLPWEARLVWHGVPRSLAPGETAELSLLMRPAPASGAFPPPFRPETPEGALLEELPLDDSARRQGLILKLRLAALEGPAELRFTPRSLPWGALTLEVPGWRIPLRPPASPALPPPEQAPAEADQRGAQTVPPFPAFSAGAPETYAPGAALFGLSGDYAQIMGQARLLWETSAPSASLAYLRRHERDSLLGPSLAFPRRVAEQSLELGPTEDEAWRPRILMPVLLAGGLGLAAGTFILYAFRRKRGKGAVTSAPSWGYQVAGLAALVMLGAGLWLGASGSAARRGVLRETGVYRIPDAGTALGFEAREGTPVRVISAAGTWAYIESLHGAGGGAGWVPLDALFFY